MKDNFYTFLKHTLKVEGGYVNDPDDAGGETNYGITRRTYEYYYTEILKEEIPPGTMEHIDSEVIHDIYKALYWDKVRGDNLPAGVDLMLADFAVNSGVSRASKMLQKVINVDQDGIIGTQTLNKLASMDKNKILHKLYMERRQYFYDISSINNNIKFYKGWLNRLNQTFDDAYNIIKSN